MSKRCDIILEWPLKGRGLFNNSNKLSIQGGGVNYYGYKHFARKADCQEEEEGQWLKLYT